MIDVPAVASLFAEAHGETDYKSSVSNRRFYACSMSVNAPGECECVPLLQSQESVLATSAEKAALGPKFALSWCLMWAPAVAISQRHSY